MTNRDFFKPSSSTHSPSLLQVPQDSPACNSVTMHPSIQKTKQVIIGEGRDYGSYSATSLLDNDPPRPSTRKAPSLLACDPKAKITSSRYSRASSPRP